MISSHESDGIHGREIPLGETRIEPEGVSEDGERIHEITRISEDEIEDVTLERYEGEGGYHEVSRERRSIDDD